MELLQGWQLVLVELLQWVSQLVGVVCQLVLFASCFFTRVLPGWEGEVERFAVSFIFFGGKANSWGGFPLFRGEGHGCCLFGDGLIGIRFGSAKSSFIRMSQ